MFTAFFTSNTFLFLERPSRILRFFCRSAPDCPTTGLNYTHRERPRERGVAWNTVIRTTHISAYVLFSSFLSLELVPLAEYKTTQFYVHRHTLSKLTSDSVNFPTDAVAVLDIPIDCVSFTKETT